MRKKVFFLSLMALVMVAGAIFGVVSCSKDGDGGSNAGVVGTWEGSKYRITFNSNNTCFVERLSSYYYGESYTCRYTMTSSTEGRIFEPESDYNGSSGESDEYIGFSVNGNTMTLYVDYSYAGEGIETIDVLTRVGGSNGGGSTANVVGTWFGQRGNSHTLQLTFNANQSGYWVENIYDSYSGNSTDQGSFTYSMSDAQNGYVYVQVESSYGDWETERIRFSISGSTMYIYDDDSSYGNQVVWTLTKR